MRLASHAWARTQGVAEVQASTRPGRRSTREPSRERLRFRPLGARDVLAIARLERSLHRPQSVTGRAQIFSELRQAERGDSNLSYGLFDHGRLVGVILAYVLPESVRGESRKDPAAGSEAYVVYLADLSLDRGYRRHLVELVARFTEIVREYLPEAPIEAHSFEPEVRLWRHLARASRELGFELDRVERLERHESGLDLSYVRWLPCASNDASALALPVSASYTLGADRYDLRIVRCVRHWERLAPYWDALLAATPDATGFQSYAYLRAWWSCFGRGRRLYILTYWSGERLCGIAPLALETRRGLSGWESELGFIGSRWEVDRPRLLFGGDVATGVELLLRFLAEPDVAWDRFHVYEQDPKSELTRALEAFGRREGQLLRVAADSSCPYLDLDRSFDEYFAARSRDFRKRMRAMHRKLAGRGELALVRVSAWPAVAEAFETYLELESRSWKRGTDAAVGSGSRARFYRALVDQLGPLGALHVISLQLDGRTIASTIAFVHDRRYYSLQIVHDQGESASSPGTVLEYLELIDCFSGDYVEYDFLGGFLTNKQRWSSTWRDTVALHVARRRPASVAEHHWKLHCVPALRSMLERAGVLQSAQRLHGRAKDALAGLLARGFGG